MVHKDESESDGQCEDILSENIGAANYYTTRSFVPGLNLEDVGGAS